jgi:hypothetical protein
MHAAMVHAYRPMAAESPPIKALSVVLKKICLLRAQ